MTDNGGPRDQEARAAARIRRQLAVARAAGDLGVMIDPVSGERYHYLTPQGAVRAATEASWDLEVEQSTGDDQRDVFHAIKRHR